MASVPRPHGPAIHGLRPDKLPPLHPALRDWTRQRAVFPEVTIPYHPAAAQFYRELEFWKGGMDQAQQKLLALNP